MYVKTNWSGYFLRIARETAAMSKDPSVKVGAVIARGRTILSTGWNGFPRGLLDTPERLADREFRHRYTVHAEINCIMNAARLGVPLEDSTLYVWGLPVCVDHCAPIIVQSGIVSIVQSYHKPCKEKWAVSHEHACLVFKEAAIEVRYLTPEEMEVINVLPQARG